jgi:DNA-binding response OmpR family regulator
MSIFGGLMKILIVEDHIKINYLLASFARGENHDVFQAYTAEEAFKALNQENYDLIITDLMLPKLQGEDLIKEIRKISDIYIMVISAKTDIDDKIDVLSLGADDYITKPFSVKEVMIKLSRIENRLVKQKPLLVSFYQGLLKIHPLKRQVYFDGDEVNLTKNEYDLLWFLVTHNKQVFSRDQLINQLFSNSQAYDRVIDAYIKNIRKKLSNNNHHPQIIKTHYGLGYQFVGEEDVI